MRLLALAAAALASASPAAATTIVDPGNDLLATFTGANDPSLDILLASATFDGATYTLSATTRGAIGLPGSLYVFGINRGAGTPRLTAGSPSIGVGINWDAVAVLFGDGTGRVATFSAGAPVITPLPSGAVSVSGASITGTVPLSLLPSTGFAPPTTSSRSGRGCASTRPWTEATRRSPTSHPTRRASPRPYPSPGRGC